jgi:DNA invertase Pin-like site-specific DNA recombinase
MLIRYARTSTADQAAELAAQEKKLKSFGVERTFTEQTPSLRNRPVPKMCLTFLQKDDYLIVTKVDGSAR